MSSTPNTLPEGTAPLQSTLPPAPPRDPVWNLWDVVMMVVITVGAIFLFFNVIALTAGAFGYRVSGSMSAHTVQIVLAAEFLGYIVLLFFMYQLVAHHYGRPFGEAVRWILPSGYSWLMFVFLGLVLSVAVQLLGKVLPSPPVLPIDRFFQDRTTAWMMMVFGVSMAPLMEELFYRGFLYPALARRVGMLLSTVVTALAFALMHSSQLGNAWAPLLILFLVGLVLTVVRIITKSVVPSFLIHVGYNATIFALIYLATDGFQHLERLAR